LRRRRYHYVLFEYPSPPLKSIARSLLLLLLVASAAGFGLYRWARQPVLATQDKVPGVEINVAPGMTVRAIGRQIAAAGLPLNPLLFAALARIERRATRLQAGSYLLVPSLTPDMLLDKMEAGDVIKIAVVIPEGWTFAQMRAALAHHPDIKQTTSGMTEAQLMTAIGATGTQAEGEFFPDTYIFTRGTTDLELFRRSNRAMQKRLSDAWASRSPDLPFATPYEALTLASVVEKETGRAEDRPQVAAVFINRLRKGMLLQTDPTVIYGMGARFDGNLRKADLTTDTPYNTYMRPGLPPTPIALVGTASLAAVVNPPRSDALYFVARGDGTSEFSEKLGDHNRAVDRYQRAGMPRTRP
jgi:UPF0755 protein